MASIPYPVSMALVKGVRRRLDFYFQRGRQVVRTWPKKSNLIPTPAQKRQRDNFRAIECCLKSQGPQQRKAWQAWNPPVGQGWVDFVHRVWMPPAFDGSLFVAPDFDKAYIRRSGHPLLQGLVLEWNPVRFPNVPNFDAVISLSPKPFTRWKWSVYDHKIQRGKLIQPRWGPAIPDASRWNSFGHFPELGIKLFRIPLDWNDICFSIIPISSPDILPLLCACQRARAVL